MRRMKGGEEELKRGKEKKAEGESDERESDCSSPEVGNLITDFQFKQDLLLAWYTIMCNTIYTLTNT